MGYALAIISHRAPATCGCEFRRFLPGSQDTTAATSGDLALDTSPVAALRRLPVRQRQVIALRLLLDLDTATTAEMLGMSGSTVATQLQRAIAAPPDRPTPTPTG
jgi:hypothetical protein